MNKHDLKIPEATFERKNRQTSWIVSILFHVALLLPLFLITCTPSTEPEDLTLIEWGGGGDPAVDAPVGLTPKGEVDGGAQRPTEPKTEVKPAQTPTSTRSPDKIHQPQKETPKQNNETQESSQETSSTSSNESEKESDNPKGKPDGEGDVPASGSGKTSASGFGIGKRRWIVDPRKQVPSSLTGQYGTVVVGYVIKSDGSVRFRKISGPTKLYNKVIVYLRKSRANVVRPGTPDVHGRGTINLKP